MNKNIHHTANLVNFSYVSINSLLARFSTLYDYELLNQMIFRVTDNYKTTVISDIIGIVIVGLGNRYIFFVRFDVLDNFVCWLNVIWQF